MTPEEAAYVQGKREGYKDGFTAGWKFALADIRDLAPSNSWIQSVAKRLLNSK